MRAEAVQVQKWEPEQNEMVTHWTGLNQSGKQMVLETEDQLHKDIDQMNIYFKGIIICSFHCLRRELQKRGKIYTI